MALLRGINVGGNRKVPMAQLRELAESLGWRGVASHVQSGNLVFAASGDTHELEARLERELERRFGFAVPVVVREGTRWMAWAKGSPFRDAESERPKALHLGVAKQAPDASVAAALAPCCRAGERIAVRDGAIWIDFAGGVARSKITSMALDRAVGSIVTLRNWRSVQAIAALVGG